MLQHLVPYVLTAAIRDKLFLSIIILMAVGVSLSIFMGASAVTETDQFALVFTASGLRFASVFGIIIFVAFFIRRSFENRDVDYLLTRPVSRLSYILSHAIAFAMIALFFTVLLGICLFVMKAQSTPDSDYLLWLFSLFAELVVMANVAFFFAMVLSSPVTSVLISAAFYILARLMGQILGIIDTYNYGGAFMPLEKIMLVISAFVPRLDLMGQTNWLLYGAGENDISFGFIAMQMLVFSAMILSGAMLDLKRKQF